MPDLPPHPSLEYLRKHAKTRKRERGIGLSQAQHQLAREYGFASWPQLVQHVHSSTLEGIERALVLADTQALARLLHADPTAATVTVDGLAPLLVLLRRSIGPPADVRTCARLLLDAGADPDSHTIEWGSEGRRSALFDAVERGDLPLARVIVYLHGVGWVFGNHHTHDRLIRELAVGAQAAVVFPNYSRSPEAKYPTAIQECYAVAEWVAEHGHERGLDGSRIAVAGDSVGGNMSAAVTLLAKQRGGPAFRQQVLFYPVTDATFDTESYHQFATGYYLRRDGMQWYWDQYTTDPAQRAEPTASPLRASLQQLAGLPPALVITGEADVLRDEGEAYADKLRDAGVPVTVDRFQAIIHDFVMLNALADTNAARGAITLATDTLRTVLSDKK